MEMNVLEQCGCEAGGREERGSRVAGRGSRVLAPPHYQQRVI